MNNIFLQAFLYVVPGILTPVLAVLTGGGEINKRTIAGMIIGAIVGGCVALKAFLSTTFANSLK